MKRTTRLFFAVLIMTIAGLTISCDSNNPMFLGILQGYESSGKSSLNLPEWLKNTEWMGYDEEDRKYRFVTISEDDVIFVSTDYSFLTISTQMKEEMKGAIGWKEYYDDNTYHLQYVTTQGQWGEDLTVQEHEIILEIDKNGELNISGDRKNGMVFEYPYDGKVKSYCFNVLFNILEGFKGRSYGSV